MEWKCHGVTLVTDVGERKKRDLWLGSAYFQQWLSATFLTGYSLLKKRVRQGVARCGLVKIKGL